MLHNALVSVSNGLVELDLRSPSIARAVARSIIARSVARSLGRSNARSLDRPVARSLGRSVARSLGRSVARSLSRSLDHSIARSNDRAVDRAIGRSVDRLDGVSPQKFHPRLFSCREHHIFNYLFVTRRYKWLMFDTSTRPDPHIYLCASILQPSASPSTSSP